MASRTLFEKFLRFAVVGATATLIQYVILVALVELAGVVPALASTIGFAVSAVANYLMNRSFTFGSALAHRVAALRFLTVVLLGLAVNFGLMLLLTRSGMNYAVAQILTTIVVLLLNFTLGARWTFK